uniref:RdRp n=1 Tax=Shahe partiti-like virus 1 TaxID=1923436 RepID=A0A1L3KLS5_9VIRU|nr:RdRp [Shahe partiti-like virus 1]APG78272.1 RdRp [Shahe partiti-like virus 1]
MLASATMSKEKISFTPLERSLFHTVESYGWKRCRPRPNEFELYVNRHRRYQSLPIEGDPSRVRHAIAKVRESLSSYRVEPQSLIRSFWKLKKDTSAGLTFDDLNESFTRKYKTKIDVPFFEVRRDVKRWKRLGYIDNPSTIAFRSHLARGTGHKTRVVFVTPYSVCSLEGKYALPLLEVLKRSSYSSPFGTQHNWLNGGLRKFKSSHHGFPTSIDFSGFDLSVKRPFIEMAFSLLRECYSLRTHEEQEWQLFQEYFINTRVRDGGVDTVLEGGIPSGSVWTHIVGSIISMFLAYYCVPDLLTVKCFGDDLVIFTKEKLSLVPVIELASTLGFEISMDKSVCGEIHWLGFNITGPTPLILNPIKRWAGFFHPDRPDETLAHHRGRLLGYALSSLGDPAFLDDFMTIWEELHGPAIMTDSCVAPEFRGQVVYDLRTLLKVFKNVL